MAAERDERALPLCIRGRYLVGELVRVHEIDARGDTELGLRKIRLRER